MKKKRKLLLTALIIIIVTVVILCIIRYTTTRAPEVEVVTISRGDIHSTILATGSVRADSYAQVSSKVAGKISRLLVKKDERVKKGQIIAELDAYDQTKKELQRLENLYADGFVSSQQVETAKEQLKNCCIVAPIEGTITEKFVEQGEMVTPGLPVVNIADLTTLQIESNIDETDIGKIKIGQPVKITLEAYPNQLLMGKVKHIALESRDLKEKGITYQVQISLDTLPVQLRLGMTGEVEIIVDSHYNIVRLPIDAIIEQDDEKVVFLLHDGSQVKKTKIHTGLTDEDWVEVLDGLQEGDLVVISDLEKLEDGKQIKIKKE